MFNKVPKLRCRKDKGIQERESLSLQTVIWKGSWIKCVTGWAVQDESGRRKFQEGKIMDKGMGVGGPLTGVMAGWGGDIKSIYLIVCPQEWGEDGWW